MPDYLLGSPDSGSCPRRCSDSSVPLDLSSIQGELGLELWLSLQVSWLWLSELCIRLKSVPGRCLHRVYMEGWPSLSYPGLERSSPAKLEPLIGLLEHFFLEGESSVLPPPAPSPQAISP